MGINEKSHRDLRSLDHRDVEVLEAFFHVQGHNPQSARPDHSRLSKQLSKQWEEKYCR